jgi:hypothetical protein
MRSRINLFIKFLALVILYSLSPQVEAAVHQWGVFEASFESDTDYSNPLQEVILEVDFTGPGSKSKKCLGFWDGGRTWRVRFSPSHSGNWNWRTSCKQDKGLDGRKGAFTCTKYEGGNPLYQHGPFKISADKWYFTYADNTPWFWLADTAWNGALLAQEKDWQKYLKDRREKGFSAIQFVTTQWRTAHSDALGQVAYTGSERIAVVPTFFQRMDERIKAILDEHMAAAPVMFWAIEDSLKINPGVSLPDEQLILLGKYMVARWGAYPCVWLMGGDGNYSGEKAQKWKRIGRAIFNDHPEQVVTMHPRGQSWVGEEFRGETWFDFIGYQSGHGDSDSALRWHTQGPPATRWKDEPHRPVVNLEPNYEDHVGYTHKSVHDAHAVRRACYWSLLVAPPAGVTYGAHGIWSWQTKAAVPLNHGGSGLAKPWHEAMDLPGAQHMKHLTTLFRSLNWWQLRPVNDIVQIAQDSSVQTRLSHVVYTRAKNGQALLFLDGQQQAQATIMGDFSPWDENMCLTLANEVTQDRPWLGRLHQVAIYDHALSRETLQKHFRNGRNKSLINPLVLYDFRQADGNTIKDTGDAGKPLDLKIADSSAVKWLSDGGLQINEPVLIKSETPAAKIINACRKTGEISIEAWITPANTTQMGPARIVSLSTDTSNRNFTLGQESSAYVMRLRTTKTTTNGLPPLSSPGPQLSTHQFVATARALDSSFALAYIPIGGKVTLNLNSIPSARSARWYNPRSGSWLEAQLNKTETQILTTPDQQDWILWLGQ